MKLKFSQQIFEKTSNIKFNQNPSNGSRAVPCGRTDMTKLIIGFRNYANAPKKEERNGQTQEKCIAGNWFHWNVPVDAFSLHRAVVRRRNNTLNFGLDKPTLSDDSNSSTGYCAVRAQIDTVRHTLFQVGGTGKSLGPCHNCHKQYVGSRTSQRDALRTPVNALWAVTNIRASGGG